MEFEAVDSCIQRSLSALYPPFEETAATLLGQVFDVLEKTYQNDALRYIIDFFIPAKHILQSLQQQACEPYAGRRFAHAGWPLCQHGLVLVQLSALDWRQLQPGDFYLQLAPPPASIRGARLLLRWPGPEGPVSEPVAEASYPHLFTTEWLDGVNRRLARTDGGHRLLEWCLAAEGGRIQRLPWKRVIYPQLGPGAEPGPRPPAVGTRRRPSGDGADAEPGSEAALKRSLGNGQESGGASDDPEDGDEGEYVELSEASPQLGPAFPRWRRAGSLAVSTTLPAPSGRRRRHGAQVRRGAWLHRGQRRQPDSGGGSKWKNGGKFRGSPVDGGRPRQHRRPEEGPDGEEWVRRLIEVELAGGKDGLAELASRESLVPEGEGDLSESSNQMAGILSDVGPGPGYGGVGLVEASVHSLAEVGTSPGGAEWRLVEVRESEAGAENPLGAGGARGAGIELSGLTLKQTAADQSSVGRGSSLTGSQRSLAGESSPKPRARRSLAEGISPKSAAKQHAPKFGSDPSLDQRQAGSELSLNETSLPAAMTEIPLSPKSRAESGSERLLAGKGLPQFETEVSSAGKSGLRTDCGTGQGTSAETEAQQSLAEEGLLTTGTECSLANPETSADQCLSEQPASETGSGRVTPERRAVVTGTESSLAAQGQSATRDQQPLAERAAMNTGAEHPLAERAAMNTGAEHPLAERAAMNTGAEHPLAERAAMNTGAEHPLAERAAMNTGAEHPLAERVAPVTGVEQSLTEQTSGAGHSPGGRGWTGVTQSQAGEGLAGSRVDCLLAGREPSAAGPRVPLLGYSQSDSSPSEQWPPARSSECSPLLPDQTQMPTAAPEGGDEIPLEPRHNEGRPVGAGKSPAPTAPGVSSAWKHREDEEERGEEPGLHSHGGDQEARAEAREQAAHSEKVPQGEQSNSPTEGGPCSVHPSRGKGGKKNSPCQAPGVPAYHKTRSMTLPLPGRAAQQLYNVSCPRWSELSLPPAPLTLSQSFEVSSPQLPVSSSEPSKVSSPQLPESLTPSVKVPSPQLPEVASSQLSKLPSPQLPEVPSPATGNVHSPQPPDAASYQTSEVPPQPLGGVPSPHPSEVPTPRLSGVCAQPLPQDPATTGRRNTDATEESEPLCLDRDLTVEPGPAASLKVDLDVLRSEILSLPGSRDRDGRALVIVTARNLEPQDPGCTNVELAEVLLYLHSISSKEKQERGLRLLMDARDCWPAAVIWTALDTFQQTVPRGIHSVLVLMGKECPTPKLVPLAFQVETLPSVQALHERVEPAQLTAPFGGSFRYSHQKWVRFRLSLESLVQACRNSIQLLRCTTYQLEAKRLPKNEKEVATLIEEDQLLMRRVLQDTRLTGLQQEGAAILVKLKREMVTNSGLEDHRDAMKTTCDLYDQVDEEVHRLVQVSNQRLKDLESLSEFWWFDDQFREVCTWLREVGKPQLEKAVEMEDSLPALRQRQQEFWDFSRTALDHSQRAQRLLQGMVHWELAVSPRLQPYADKLRDYRALVTQFTERLQHQRLLIERIIRLHEFFRLAYSWCPESPQTPAGLRPDPCPSADDLKQPPPHPDSRLWDLAKVLGDRRLLDHWPLCWASEHEGHLAITTGSGGGVGPPPSASPRRGPEGSASLQDSSTPQPERRGVPPLLTPWLSAWSLSSSPEHPLLSCPSVQYPRHSFSSSSSSSPDVRAPRPLSPLSSSAAGRRWDPAGPLRKAQSFELAPGPSPSREEVCPRKAGVAPTSVVAGVHIRGLEVSSTQLVDRSCSPREHVMLARRGEIQAEAPWGASPVLGLPAKSRARRVLTEALLTEREYIGSMELVLEGYRLDLERPDAPPELRGKAGLLFGNLEKLLTFHRERLLPEMEGCATCPLRLGETFLRHKEQFMLYALYVKSKPQSDALLASHGNAFFKRRQLLLRDRTDLASLLLKPIQRLASYSLLLRELLAECGEDSGRDRLRLQAALDMVNFQRHHGNDLLAMDAIRGSDVNLKEQGCLLRQDHFTVCCGRRKSLRHVFLFEELVVFTKWKRVEDGSESYIYKSSLKTAEMGLTENIGDSGLRFELWFRRRRSNEALVFQAESLAVKQAWTQDIARILWRQASRNKELRLQEMVSMGVGSKVFLDLAASDGALEQSGSRKGKASPE